MAAWCRIDLEVRAGNPVAFTISLHLYRNLRCHRQPACCQFRNSHVTASTAPVPPTSRAYMAAFWQENLQPVSKTLTVWLAKKRFIFSRYLRRPASNAPYASNEQMDHRRVWVLSRCQQVKSPISREAKMTNPRRWRSSRDIQSSLRLTSSPRSGLSSFRRADASFSSVSSRCVIQTFGHMSSCCNARTIAP